MFTMFMLSLQVFYEHYPWWLRWEKSAHNVGDLSSIPGLERSPGEGNGNRLQDSCLENPMDRGAWQTTLHRVAKSQTQMSDFTFTIYEYY